MQDKEGNKKPPADYDEEWQTSDSGHLSRMWNQDVQDREEISSHIADRFEGLDFSDIGISSPFILRKISEPLLTVLHTQYKYLILVNTILCHIS